ncbi:recombinase family protein [Nocardia sp. NEAU-G5]|uniref:Recombinase family protein n=1 Tax=Nocardia albiluteola TaxID=2842303 RepID=A0ABS6AUA9_9NOCA|nr:recombinase family protein [Nocardia albiluteola]MBU3060836.1 recombinase family protein [Nocardia albiluteola]
MRIGYGRVSTRDQHPEAQLDALAAAGCEQIFIDKASGKLASRPELSKALLVANRPTDQLVVTKLDRLGRSLEHLIELSRTLQDRKVMDSQLTRHFRLSAPAVKRRPPMPPEERIELLGRILTASDQPLRSRAAAAIVLLYAQPLTRVVRLTIDDVK